MKKLIIASIVSILALTGCAEKGNKPESKDKTDKAAITIEHALGNETFTETPKRVVILEWGPAEDVLALGVQPVGLTDIDGFNTWVKIDETLDESVVDLGTRQEPNLEAIAKLSPDVIITVASNHEPIKAELEKIAPTIFWDSNTEEAQDNLYADMIETFKKTATLLDKEAEGKVALKEFDEKLKATKQEIEALDLPDTNFLFTQAYSANQAPEFRLFTPNSIVSHTLEEVGLTNIITDQSNPAWGFISVNLEGLTNYDDAMLIHAVQKDDPLFKNVADNKIWQELNFVKEDRLVDIGGDTWTFGGLLSAETLIDNLVTALKEVE